MPSVHTPKLVIIKNKQAPNNDPVIRFIMFFAKNLEPSPIKITLPHVKRVTSWKPITKSVNIKLIKTAGKYLTPRSAGA